MVKKLIKFGCFEFNFMTVLQLVSINFKNLMFLYFLLFDNLGKAGYQSGQYVK